MSLSTSDWIAISSATIALCVFFATFWQARLSKKHAIMSIKPVLALSLIESKESIESNSCEIFTNLENVGIGPAKIVSFDYYVNDKKVIKNENTDKMNLTEQAFLALENPALQVATSLELKPGHYIKAENTEELLRIVTDSNQVQKFYEDLDKIKLIIKYEDLYGNLQEPLDSSKFS